MQSSGICAEVFQVGALALAGMMGVWNAACKAAVKLHSKKGSVLPETASTRYMLDPEAFGHGWSETLARLWVMAHLVTQPHTATRSCQSWVVEACALCINDRALEATAE